MAKLRTYILLDRSGSMGSCWTSAIDGINSYVSELKEGGGKGRISVNVFDTDHSASGSRLDLQPLRSEIKLKDFLPLKPTEIGPRGSTPLYDAVGTTIKRIEADKGDRVALVIMTDGYENSSQEFTEAGVKKLVNKKQAEGWLITYLGANQDAISVGATMGVAAGNAMTFTTQNFDSTFKSAARGTQSYAGADNSWAGQGEAEYTDEERKSAVK